MLNDLKVGIALWNELGYCVFMHNWYKARIISTQIDVFKSQHPIVNFLAKWLHVWF